MNKNFNLLEYLEEKRKIVNGYLELILQRLDMEDELVMAVKHSLMTGGKRLRPILSLASARACGKDFLPALPCCCAIEMIHTYSLIHDDLPAMDNDDLRRGVPSCHKKFSETTAILAGDALLTHAFNIVSEPEGIFEKYPESDITVKLIAKISDAAGINGMVKGQMLDMQHCKGKKEFSLGRLRKTHSLKTGKMIILSVETGAISVGADRKTIDKLTAYARDIGLAFQVMDDILNIEGNPEITGKPSGSDALGSKMTFPGLIGLNESKKYTRQLIENAFSAIETFDEKADPLRAIAEYIINRNH